MQEAPPGLAKAPRTTTAGEEPFGKLKDLRLATLRAMLSVASFAEGHSSLCIFFLWLCLLPLVLLKIHYWPFTGDEVYTLRIAQTPTLSGMLALSQRLDLHPPLHYLLQHFALMLPLPILFASRLPSVVSMLLLVLCVFRFVSARAGSLMGVFSSAILLFTLALEFAWSNRPYALWIALLALAAWAWQRAVAEPRSRSAPVLLFGAFTAMCLDYMAGLLCLLPFFLAETLRFWQRKRLDWQILAALLLPAAASTLYLHQVKDFAHNTFAPQYMPSFDRLADMYSDLVTQPLLVTGTCLVAATLLLAGRSCSANTTESMDGLTEQFATQKTTLYTAPELALGWGLVILPGLMMLAAAWKHNQFFPRYGACGTVGVAFVAPWLLLRYVRYARAVALLVVLSFVITMIVLASSADFSIVGPWRTAKATGVPPYHLDRLDPALPLVIANAVDYTEMNERETPALLAHTYYVYDREAARIYSGSTVYETEDQTAALLHFQSRTASYAAFVAGNRQFYMTANYIHTEEWLPRKLMASGCDLQYLGKFESTYTDDDLYLVTVPTGSLK